MRAPTPLLVQLVVVTCLFLPGLLYPPLGRPGWIAPAVVAVIALIAARLAPVRAARWSRRLLTGRGKRLAFAALTLVLFLGTAEYVARILTQWDVLEFHAPMQTMLPPGTEDWRMAHITADALREPDPVLLWRPARRAPYNRQGFKGTVVALPRPPATERIICYGDSNTDGPDSGGWPSALQGQLDRHPPSGDRRYEVLNAGVAGYSSHQGLLRLKEEIDRFQPTLVLVSFGWNDLAGALGRPDREFQPPAMWLATLQRLLLRYRVSLTLLHYLRRAPAPADAQNPTPRVPLEDYVANMREFAKTARAHGATVVYLTRPHRSTRRELEGLAPNWRARVPSYNDALRALATEDGAIVVDVARHFEGRTDLFADEAHFTDDGHEIMAAFLVAELRRRGAL